MSYNPKLKAALKTLTPRELEVRNLVICKRTTAQIAKALKISPASVHTHTHRIRTKLGFTPGSRQDGDRTTLTPAQREAVSLRGQGRTHREIAEMLGLKEQSVNNLLYQARMSQRRACRAGDWESDPLFN